MTGKQFKKARLYLKLSQQEMGELLGLGVGRIVYIEEGSVYVNYTEEWALIGIACLKSTDDLNEVVAKVWKLTGLKVPGQD